MHDTRVTGGGATLQSLIRWLVHGSGGIGGPDRLERWTSDGGAVDTARYWGVATEVGRGVSDRWLGNYIGMTELRFEEVAMGEDNRGKGSGGGQWKERC